MKQQSWHHQINSSCTNSIRISVGIGRYVGSVLFNLDQKAAFQYGTD